MGIASDLAGIKEVSDTIVANKVSKFAYTDYAYEHNDADGVDTYNVDNEQNIPLGTPSVMKVNETVVTKGWRARASSITRMLMNHFLGRLSYNVNKLTDMFSSLLTVIGNNMGVANGFASLDANGRIPYSQLPESAVELKGYWNANTNTPTLVDGTGTNGDEYYVDVAGTQDLGSGEQNFLVGDRVLYIDNVWKNISGGTVRTVNNVLPDALGNVTLAKSDTGQSNGQDTIFTSKGAFDYTLGSTTAMSWLNKVFGRLLANFWKFGTGDNENIPITTKGLYYANNLYQAGSNGSGMYWSTDGKHWTKGTGVLDGGQGVGVFINDIIFADNVWCIATSKGIYWSENGKDWEKDTNIFPEVNINYVAYANGLWEITGANGIGVYWSEDRETWTRGTGFNSISTGNYILYANNLWLAGFASNNIFWSEDGKNWTAGTGFTNIPGTVKIIFANDIWLSVGGTGQYTSIYWSEDGKNWTGVNNTDSYMVRDVKYACGIFVFATTKGLYWSRTGKNTTSTEVSVGMEGVNYANGLWLANGSQFSYSEDGRNWKPIYSVKDSIETARILIYGKGLWVAGTNTGCAWSSIELLLENGYFID